MIPIKTKDAPLIVVALLLLVFMIRGFMVFGEKMSLSDAKDVATIFGVLLTLLVAIWGVIVYGKNSVLERAKWLEKLYDKFYEDAQLKTVRDIIDCEEHEKVSQEQIKEYVDKELTEFTDYLNFFEFVAILENNKQLTTVEVQDLFNYYLFCLYKNDKIRNYIGDPEKGFEKLHGLFDKIFKDKK